MKPAKYLQEWFDVDYYGEDLAELSDNADTPWDVIFKKYDVVVVKQVDNEMAAGRMLYFRDLYKKPLLLDLDDNYVEAVSYTHLRAHETVLDLVCRLLLEKKN